MDRRRWGWAFGLGLGVAIAPGVPVQAQIIPDGSLGSEASVTTPMETGVQIDGGALRGDNLFHSFQEFSIPTNSEAFFNNPDVANIFSRVTGGSISDIDGLLRANGTANLFLLNPNGIVFGPNARLDIGGSFVASTANSLVFENGLEFSASDSGDTAPLLSVNVPLGVQFNGNPGSLEATEATLNLSEGEAIALVGGEISLDDVEINAPAGRIDLVGVGEAGQVSFEVGDVDSGFPSGGFGVPADLSRASVSLDQTNLNVAGLVGGEIGIQALDVEMRDSALLGGIAEGFGIEGGQSGNIELDAIGHISISDSRLNNEVEEGSIGNAGDINLLANTVEMTNGARLTLSTTGRGNAGSVTVNANESIVISGSNSDEFPSGINVSVREGGQGDVGQVNLSGEFIEISDGAFILSGSLGEGNTGNVTLEARETVSLLTEGRISTAVLETGQGNVGNISVIGSQVEVRDGAQLNSMTLGQGNAGRIDIHGSERIVFSGEDSEGLPSAAFSFSDVGETGLGDAGDVTLISRVIQTSDGAFLSSRTSGEGDSGNVTIEGHESVLLSGGFVLSGSSGETQTGNAGNVRITGERIELRDEVYLSSSASGDGDGGTITVESSGHILFSNSRASSTSFGEDYSGNAGNISVIGETVELRDRASLSSSTRGQGDAGNISVIGETIELRDEANLSSDTFGQGNAGNISVIGETVELWDGASLSSSTLSDGDGGTITVEASGHVLFSDSSVLSSSLRENTSGNAGNISVIGETVELRDGASLSSDTQDQGDAGNVVIIGETVELRDEARLSSSTLGAGDAGRVIVEASGHILFSDSSVLSSSFGENYSGNAGNIRITGETVELRDRAILLSSTRGDGDAGRIIVEASGHVLFSDSSASSGSFGEDSSGNAGNIRITSETVELRDGAELSSGTFGEGDAGNVTIEARDTARFVSGNVLSTVEETGRGNAGNIRVIGDRVEVQDGAQLSSSTSGQGDAGRINIQGAEAIIFSGENSEGSSSGAFSDVRQTGQGNAGEVNLRANHVEVRDGARLSSSTFGEGDAGNVTIEARDTARFSNANVFSSVEETGRGNAGNVGVIGNRVEVQDGAQLISSTSGQGNAGRINIQGAEAIIFSGEDSEGLPSAAFSSVRGMGRGNAGEVNLQGNYVEVSDGARLSSSTFGEGDAGNVTIEARDTARFLNGDVFSSVGERGLGNAGNISVTGDRVEVQDGAQLSSSTSGQGNAGRINIQGAEAIIFSGEDSEGLPSAAFSSVRGMGRGNAGEVNLQGNYVEVSDGAELSSSTFGEGDAGNVTIEARDTARVLNGDVLSTVEESGQGNGGNIQIFAGRLFMEDGARLNSSTLGQGNAGTVTIQASGEVLFSNSFAASIVGENTIGDSGGVNIIAGRLEVRDGAALISSSLGQGDAGNIRVEVSESIMLSNGFVFSTIQESGQGNAGDINIISNSLEMRNRSQLNSSTLGEGNAGTVRVEARDSISFSGLSSRENPLGIFSLVEETGRGNAGGVSIRANTVEMNDGAQLSSSTFGRGNAGTVTIEANDRVILSGPNNPEGFATGAFSAVGDTGQGNAGDVRILANSLEMRDGAQLSSVTLGQGNAGTVTVEASDTVIFSGVDPEGKPSAGLTSVGETGQGNAGGVSVLANALELRDGAVLDSSTLGEGNAGTVSIEVSETFLLSNGFVGSGVGEEGRGNAGNVTVVANQLEVHDGLLISSSFNEGDAGTVTVEVQDTAIFSGFYTHPSGSAPSGWRSGLYSTVEETGQGNAGGVNLIAGTVELRDGARLSSSNNTTFNANDFAAGDVFVQADRLRLSDRADISANTGGRGGNVRLNTGTTILRRGSTIQTNAEGDFPGGNIIIDTDALVALENSDITANALNAAGGQVIINSQGIFGTEFRDELTPQSDITATSDLGAEFSGSVELNTPEVDTATGLVDLSANPIDVAALLDTDPCTLGRESEFYVTGRGGLPPNPDGSLATETTWVDWRSLEDNSSETAMARDEETAPLVEAQGWHVNGEGSVVLSAQTPDGSATPPQRMPAHCSPLTPTP